MRIGIDFDRVIFDTDSFNEYLKEEVEGLEHVETSPYNEHGVYSPEIHAEICGIDVERIYDAMEELGGFVYDDISDISSTDHELVLITRGQKYYQKKKIEGAGVEDKFDKTIVVEKGSKDVADIDFLIDDQKREIEKAGVPGFEFDREKHSLSDALEEAEKHET
ncbi:MAG: hypothetical protein ABEK16_05070 [Candidatus Nanohalobium sp.]